MTLTLRNSGQKNRAMRSMAWKIETRLQMRIVEVTDKKTKKKFLDFRKKIYQNQSVFVDNNLFVLQELFYGRTSFTERKKIFAYNVEEDAEGNVICQGLCIYAESLPEYIQLCFFESEPNRMDAVQFLVEQAMELGRLFGCKKLVIGLNGHVNYGLGFLDSHYDLKNTFSSSANPEYYNAYFRKLRCEEVHLNTYKIEKIDTRLERYQALFNKLDKNYTFRYFDKKQFTRDSEIYTDLNNICFKNHRYYYARTYAEDREMLKELFLFMKEDSLIFAFENEKPVGFIMWYPDFNALAKQGEAFGTKHFLKNIVQNKKIETAKIMEFGVLEEYRTVGLPLALIRQIFQALPRYGISKVDTSWVLAENKDSNSVCKAVCDDLYKRFVVYEKRID